jgi:hypothetical protein
LVSDAIAEAAADGAGPQTTFALRVGACPASDPAHELTIGSAAVPTMIEDLSGRVNPNFGSPITLAALLGAAGADSVRVLIFIRAMLDWRAAAPISVWPTERRWLDISRRARHNAPRDRRLDSAHEYGRVVGMPP